jgi:hypothetical protein
MQNQYLITKDENGNYVIASPVQSSDSKSYTLEKLCTLTCSGNDPCKNCDKCNKPTPVAPPIQVDPATLLAYLRQKNGSKNGAQKNIQFVDTKGGLSTVSVVLIALGVLLLLIAAFYLYKFLYKKFNKLLSKKEARFDYNDSYIPEETRNFMGLPDNSDKSDNWSTIDTDDA